ncbi:MAG: aminopeptidase P family protein [Alphaproteobacteria bacterium]|nr:aminopeptidase P family protein [Alphaproteobacteria bacterium]
MIAREEFAARAARIRAELEALGADVLMIDHGELLAWATGYTVSETMHRAAFIARDGRAWWALRLLDLEPCRRRTWIEDVHAFADHEDARAAVAESVRTRGFAKATIAVDSNSYGFSAATAARLRELLPDARWVDAPGISDRLRWVKSPAEIALLRKAAAVGDAAMRAIQAAARPGITAREAAAIAAAAFLREGADTGDVGPIARATGDVGFLHAALDDTACTAGDVLHVELIPKVANYSGRVMRPILIGGDPRGLAQATAMLARVQDAQFAAMKPGALARDVDAIVREGVQRLGLRETYVNATGYTTGLYARTPRSSDFSRIFVPNSDWTLEAGMVFHMYTSARGVALSETVAVTAAGGERLSTLPRGALIAA